MIMVINGNEWDPIALANEMNHVYNRFKHLNDGNASDYISVYFGQIWIPDIFEDTEEALKHYGLWLETGEGDPTDVYVCGNIEGDE